MNTGASFLFLLFHPQSITVELHLSEIDSVD